MINQTNTLFVFVASVLVFFMTPGLAFSMVAWFQRRML